MLKSCRRMMLGLLVLGLLTVNAPADIITYVWHTSNLESGFYQLISANGYFSLDSSLFDTNNSNQTIYFKSNAVVNVTAFHFEFVTDLRANGLATDTYDLANIVNFAGVFFDATKNPPVVIATTGAYTADGNNEVLTIAGGGFTQIAVLGAYNEYADGTFIATNVISTVNTSLTNLVFSVSGTNLNLSWPTDHIGWRLLIQTNHLANGISRNTNDWGTVANSASTNQITVPMLPANPTEFFRLVYP